MEAKELRLGNYVKCKISNDGAYYLVEGIENYGQIIRLGGVREGEKISIKNIKPILITLEILHKAGFEKHKNSNEYWNHWVLKNGWCVSEWIWHCPLAGFEKKGVCYWGEEYIPIRYLHSLQNFYFCHTSQELKINI